MKLNYFENPWPLTMHNCPCDVHFADYLEQRQVTGKLIFHFGTGAHHLLGKRNQARGNPNEILAITASPDEYQLYMDYIIAQPQAANFYKVLFADIYTLSARLLPGFDFVTLFHLCEYYDDREYKDEADYEKVRTSGDIYLNSAYARLDDKKLLQLFLNKLNPAGKLLFFKRSSAWEEKAAPLVDSLIAQGELAIEDEYESLLICGRA